MRKAFFIISVVLLLLLLAGCAADPNPNIIRDSVGGAGFWTGLWHGFILPFTFIISLFNSNVQIYEVRNSGDLYNFGFVVGAFFIMGALAASTKNDESDNDD